MPSSMLVIMKGRLFLHVVCMLTYFIHVIMVSSVSSQQCSTIRLAPIKFSISTSRNTTGHWTAQLSLQHSGDKFNSGDQETGAWEVDLKQTTDILEDRETVLLEAKVTAPPLKAGPDYELVPGVGYYKFHTTLKPWDEAKKTCSKEGGHLVILNSERELEVVHGIFRRYPKVKDGWENDFALVGFHDMYKEGQYQTVLGASLESTGFVKWATSEPSDKNKAENCGCIHRNEPMFDVGCNNIMAFICEQELW
ncbi:unnamed protein product [Timema podura]|uniref:C-type lectin domain-containing protein n=1 Tax=Timema podura TaxID=61482 RepID=A0ABN7NI17_TIMPD|nr:unnamed protein product [Timema podura]